MNELQELGYKPGEVTKNTFVYVNRQGQLSAAEVIPGRVPQDYSREGFYPSAIWVDEAGMDMRHAYNKGKI